MTLVDIRSVEEWSDATINCSKMVSNWCGVRVPSLTLVTKLSKIGDDWAFMILRAWQLRVFVHSGLKICPDSGASLTVYKLASDSTCHASSCSGADLFLVQQLRMLCRIYCLDPLMNGR